MATSILYQCFVGIDISKTTLDICALHLPQRSYTFTQICNSPDGFLVLERWMSQQGINAQETLICSEHTGRYGERLTQWMSRHKWPHSMLNTTSLAKVTPEHHRKTDQYDAQKLAEFGYRFWDTLRLHQAPRPELTQLKRLQAERRKLVGQRASLKQKCKEAIYHSANMETLLMCWKQQMELLSEHIICIEKRIAEVIKADAILSRRYKQLKSAPGVGAVVGTYLLTIFAGQDQLNPKQVASRYGFAPHAYQSGTSVRRRRRSARFGNPEMRRLLHQAALSVSTHHPIYRAYYQRKMAEGKHHLLVINNIINKLIRLYCSMWNNNQEYSTLLMMERTHL